MKLGKQAPFGRRPGGPARQSYPQWDQADGNYGGYFGEIWKWGIWQGCDSDGMAWNGTNFNDAMPIGTSSNLGNTAEWTYNNETSSISSFPTGRSVGGVSADFFANAPTACQDAWQRTGGSMHNDSSLRIDQLYGPSFSGSARCN